jgi:hypothetical protein
MGYATRFNGEITITPPIPWGQIKDSPFLPDAAKPEPYLTPSGRTYEEDTA